MNNFPFLNITYAPSFFKFQIQKREFHSTSVIFYKEKNIKISDPFSFYLDSIRKIILDNNLSLKDRQLKIEKSWMEIIQNLQEDQKYIESKYSYSLISKIKEGIKTLNIINKRGTLERKFPKIYFMLNKIEFLMITFSLAIHGVNLEMGYTNISSLIGKKIIQYIYYNEKIEKFKKNIINNKINNVNESDCIYKIFKYQEFLDFIEIDNTQIILLGDFFISILMTFPSDIFERIFDYKEGLFKKELAKLIVNPIYFEEIKNNLVIDPASLPMICEPLKWNEKSFGGYLTNEILKEDLITGSNHHGHIINFKENLYKAINIMSSVKFSINSSLLEYLNKEGKYLIEKRLDDSEELQKITTLQIGETYKNLEFYLPLQCDWRGRIYTKPFFINYQGGDLSLSLLEFHNGEKLSKSGINSLYIYGANNYNQKNISKDTYPNRIKWVKKNLNNILKMDPEFILKAENKFVFTAFCLTIRELNKNPNFKVKIPVFLDATCSGIQHLAAVMRDLQLASEVNLVPQTDSIPPSDIYNSLRDPINERIRQFGRDNPLYSNLSLINFSRNDVKPSIMTTPYNVTQRGIREQFISRFKLENKKDKNKCFLLPAINGKNISISIPELDKISQIVHKAIFKIYPSLDIIYKYFINMTKVLNNLEIPVIWFTPCGLEIIQNYYISKQNKVAINFAGKTKKMVIKEWIKKVDKNKQRGGIIPNIIHSLDASHLINVLLHSNDIKPVITVHDCFGTHPNNLDKLSHIVKIEFIKIYTDSNFLEKFHIRNKQNILDNNFRIYIDEITNEEFVLLKRTKIYLPNVPKLGNLDLNGISKSKYMIT